MRAFLDNHPNWQIDLRLLIFLSCLPHIRGLLKYGLISIKWMVFYRAFKERKLLSLYLIRSFRAKCLAETVMMKTSVKKLGQDLDWSSLA